MLRSDRWPHEENVLKRLVVCLLLFPMLTFADPQDAGVGFTGVSKLGGGVTIEDDFTSDTTVTDNWDTHDAGFDTTTNTDQLTPDGTTFSIISHKTTLGTVDQWAYAELIIIAADHAPGVILHTNGGGGDGDQYNFVVRGWTDDVAWCANDPGGVCIDTSVGTFTDGNWLACRIKNTGVNTDAECYEFTSRPPDYVNDVQMEAGSGYVSTWAFTQDPTESGCTGLDAPHGCCASENTADSTGACIGTSADESKDDGDYVGVIAYDNGGGTPILDSWKAGSIP